jgi:hypothetical protein
VHRGQRAEGRVAGECRKFVTLMYFAPARSQIGAFGHPIQIACGLTRFSDCRKFGRFDALFQKTPKKSNRRPLIK